MRTFYIANESVMVAPNWSITDKINTRTTLSMTVVDLKDLTSIDNGDTVEIYEDLTKIFAGFVQTITVLERSRNQLEYSITACDNTLLADKRVIAKVYENELAGDIVADLITEKLSAEGVIAGTIQNGPTIVKAVFNYIKVSEALNYIKTITGYSWTIDKDKKLHFFERSTLAAPWVLSPTVQHFNFKQNKAMDQYRNTQYVRGGKVKTASQTETPTPKPDGESRNFVLRFGLAEKPIIEINLNGAGYVAVDPENIGINGLNTGMKWYFSYDSQILTQDSAETVLGNTDSIRVTYTGLRNLFLMVDNPVEVNARQVAEAGTSGIYEHMAVEKSINDKNQATQFGQGLIETYGEIKDDITFDTNVSGLQAGQLLTVQKPLYDINEQFLIESVTVRPEGSLLRYSIKALDGASLGGWEEFFKYIVKQQKDYVIEENEVIITMQNQVETEGYQGSEEIAIFNCLYPSDSLYPSDTLYPGTLISEVNLSD